MNAFLLLLAASSLASLGIVFPALWFTVFLGLGLFFALLQKHIERLWVALTCGLIFGVATGGAGTIWFWDTLPLSFLGINDPVVQRIAVGMTWSYVAVSLGLPVMVGAVAIWRLRTSRWFPLIAVLIWELTEIGRMWSFALTTWGPESLFGPHFSSASIGYPLTETAFLARVAYPLGINALNLIVATISACLAVAPYAVSQRSYRAPLSVTMACALAVCVPSLITPAVSTSSGAKNLRFAIISENIEDVRDLSTHPRIADTLAQVAAAIPPVDVIVLPEEFSLTSIFWSKNEATTFLAKHFQDRDVLILNTRNELYPEEERNENPESKKLVYDSTSRGEIGRYTKQMLMPLGEYAPYFTHTFFSLLQDPELHLFLQDLEGGSPVPRHINVAEFSGVRLGGLLCSDMLSPHLYRSLVGDHGAQVLVNLSNHFWFHGSKPLYWKTLQMARVHAVQNRAPILVSNNVAPSFALDADGRTIAESTLRSRQVLYVDIPVPLKTENHPLELSR